MLVLDVPILRGHNFLQCGFYSMGDGAQDAKDISRVGGPWKVAAEVGPVWEGFQGEKAADLAALFEGNHSSGWHQGQPPVT